MNDKEKKYVSWINSILETAKENPSSDIINLIEGCGMECAKFNGHLDGVNKLCQMADNCHTRTDYTAFFNDILHIKAEEVEDGIVLHLDKPHCACPMAPEVRNSALCNCTKGHEKAVWSKFFGTSIDVEIVESWLMLFILIKMRSL